MSATADDDLIQPFQLHGARLRGHLVRLGPAADAILAAHDYPRPVSELVGQAVALTALLSASVKLEGTFTLQTQSDGPVKLMVSDFRTGGHLRGMAKFDAEAIAALDDAEPPALPDLVGIGHLAFTIDQGEDTERYQGIVALEGASLAECAESYFRRSEQLATEIILAAAPGPDGGWRAAGMMLQRMPGAQAHLEVVDDEVESWHSARALMGTLRAEELLDRGLSSDRLLYRLFHETGVWVHETRAVLARCSCDRERVERVLRSFEKDEILDMAEDGVVVVTCEFCNAVYRFAEDEF